MPFHWKALFKHYCVFCSTKHIRGNKWRCWKISRKSCVDNENGYTFILLQTLEIMAKWNDSNRIDQCAFE